MTATTPSLSVVMLLQLLCLEGSQRRQLPSLPTAHPPSPTTATSPLSEDITINTPFVSDAAKTSVCGVSAAVDHSVDACCWTPLSGQVCSAGVRVLFDQFKVKQSNILKSVMTRLQNDLREVRQETFHMKATSE